MSRFLFFECIVQYRMLLKLSTAFLLAIWLIQLVSSETTAPTASASRALFVNDLFNRIVKHHTTENVIFSPVSIQTCVALAYIASEGKTANELQRGLRLSGFSNKQDVAESFTQLLRSANQGEVQLQIANRIYVNEGNEIAPKFNEIATKNFDTEAEVVRFADSKKTVEKINNWVESKTNQKIKNLMQAESVNADTKAVLVNAIHFKAKWAKPFDKISTRPHDFFVNPQLKVQTDMMFNDDSFKFGTFETLDATCLEMSYINSDFSMMLILPNKKNGLSTLEDKLKDIDIGELADKLEVENVAVIIPKFRIEFNLNLKSPLQEMGMPTIFSREADFSGLLKTTSPMYISEAQHKAFIDVNEEGSEAAAATHLNVQTLSGNINQKVFVADHPFVFVIRNKEATYFAGHVAKF